MGKRKVAAFFDIDFTLLDGSEAHVQALTISISKIVGKEINLEELGIHGLTDQGIILRAFLRYGLSQQRAFEKLGECLELLEKEFKKLFVDERPKILLGVMPLLGELKKRKIPLGIVTGNLETIAEAKLTKSRMDGYFICSGFGSDCVERHGILEMAMIRLGNVCEGLENRNIFYFGDTPNDIKAANRLKIKPISVATGNYSIEDLQESGAEFVVPELTRAHAILQYMGIL